MDILEGPTPDNYKEVRGRMLSANANISRDTSISLMKSSEAYHERMEQNNDMIVNKDINNVSPELPYETSQEKAFCLSKAAAIKAIKYDNQPCLTLDSL